MKILPLHDQRSRMATSGSVTIFRRRFSETRIDEFVAWLMFSNSAVLDLALLSVIVILYDISTCSINQSTCCNY